MKTASSEMIGWKLGTLKVVYKGIAYFDKHYFSGNEIMSDLNKIEHSQQHLKFGINQFKLLQTDRASGRYKVWFNLLKNKLNRTCKQADFHFYNYQIYFSLRAFRLSLLVFIPSKLEWASLHQIIKVRLDYAPYASRSPVAPYSY